MNTKHLWKLTNIFLIAALLIPAGGASALAGPEAPDNGIILDGLRDPVYVKIASDPPGDLSSPGGFGVSRTARRVCLAGNRRERTAS